MIKNIPNILTLLRLILVPIFVICFYLPFDWHFIAAAIIFCLAAITDYLDGYLARKLQQSTAFGAFIDPVADKLIVIVALILLVSHYSSTLITLSAVIIIGREITVSALREWMAELGQRATVAVSDIGKYKTMSQLLALLGLIWQQNYWMIIMGYLLLYISVFLTLWSMIIYINAAKKLWRSTK